MRRTHLIQFIITLFFLSPLFGQSNKTLELRLSNPLEIGKEKLTFRSIVSVCEDDKSNFYVLDKLENRVFKFSSSGEFLRSFGHEGQGPGDFQRPNHIAFTENGEIVVCDEVYYLSFFQVDGAFIKRIDLNGRMAPAYIGTDSFYAWIWRPEDKQQILCNANNSIVRTFHTILKNSFSVEVPDRSGRAVMFNYPRDEFAPAFQFAFSGKYSAIAVSDNYEITLLDNAGNTFGILKRNIRPERIEKTEKEYLVKEIESLARQRGWPKSVNRKILKTLPPKKTYFDKILLNDSHVYIFRIKTDITQEESSIPVDIFSINSKFLGTVPIDKKPIFVSEKYMYFVQEDKEGNIFLVRRDYFLNL